MHAYTGLHDMVRIVAEWHICEMKKSSNCHSSGSKQEERQSDLSRNQRIDLAPAIIAPDSA